MPKPTNIPGHFAKTMRRRSLVTLFSNGPIVLFYHGVEKVIGDPRVQTVHMLFSDFERQICYLRKHFEIISLDDLHTGLANGCGLEPGQVVITFDDGYRNNLSLVSPFLSALSIPFSVFVSTRHISDGLRFPTYYVRAAIYYTRKRSLSILGKTFDTDTEERRHATVGAILKEIKRLPHEKQPELLRDLNAAIPADQWADLNAVFASDEPMNWSEISQLHAAGAQIGSHCHDHFILHSNQSAQNIDTQLTTSRMLISDNVGCCNYIAYPNGGMRDISPDAMSKVMQSDYLLGFTTVPGEVSTRSSQYLLPRIGGSLSNIARFKLRIRSCFRHNNEYYRWLQAVGRTTTN